MTDTPLEDACDGFSLSAMDWAVRPFGDGTILEAGGRAMRCAIGRGGFKRDKHEGDGGTPVGRWALREAFYRPDRMTAPPTPLKLTALTPADGWCDAPDDPNYNHRVALPYPAAHEELWRMDAIYDVIVPLGYNDDPVVPGRGSAIFLHIAHENYSPTAGCIAVAREDILALLQAAHADTGIIVRDC